MIHGMLLDKIKSIKTAMGDDSVFDILGRLIGEDMVRRIYEELKDLPHEMWRPKIMAAFEEIERTREDIRQKTDLLFAGRKLDRTLLDDLKNVKMRSVDASDIRRFLETWTESNDGKYDEHDNRVSIRAPRHLAFKIGGVLNGTLDSDLARELNLEYLALGNKRVQSMLEDAMSSGHVASLGHMKKSGILCVYSRSVIDGDGRERDSEIVMVFCNEDGGANLVDADSVWDYEELDSKDVYKPVNTNLLVTLKNLADKKMSEDSQKFYDKAAEKLHTMCRRAKSAVDANIAAEIEQQNAKIAEWELKKHAAPNYSRLIKDAHNKNQAKKTMGEKRKSELDRRFGSRLVVDLVGLATVTPKDGANARTMSDRAGMGIVLDLERRRAQTDAERLLVEDVSDRDKGYDIETKDRSIEVKSFEAYPDPQLTSHEWSVAQKFGDRYWLYVVENVHTTSKVHEIQNPCKKLAEIVTVESTTTEMYRFKWADWKKILDSVTGA